MRQALRPHPDWPCAAVARIEVDVARPGPGALELVYGVSGATRDLYLPPAGAARRTDELWRRTCFEAFVRAGEGYVEFNFSPSGAWAAYAFSGYRTGMRAADGLEPPRIAVRQAEGFCEVRVSLAGLSLLPANAAWRLGLAAVIEEKGGAKSYWALAHPPGKADFHHPDGFAAELPPTEQA